MIEASATEFNMIEASATEFNMIEAYATEFNTIEASATEFNMIENQNDFTMISVLEQQWRPYRYRWMVTTTGLGIDGFIN